MKRDFIRPKNCLKNRNIWKIINRKLYNYYKIMVSPANISLGNYDEYK